MKKQTPAPAQKLDPAAGTKPPVPLSAEKAPGPAPVAPPPVPALAAKPPSPASLEKQLPLAVPFSTPISIPKGAFDTRIDAGAPPAAPTPAQQPPAVGVSLPKGARVIMRKSGGLRFTSQEIVVYADGRATRGPTGDAAPREQRLTPAQMDALQQILQRLDFAKLPPWAARQNPDAYAYEIAVRLTRRLHVFQVADGSIPASVAPLIRELEAFTAGGS